MALELACPVELSWLRFGNAICGHVWGSAAAAPSSTDPPGTRLELLLAGKRFSQPPIAAPAGCDLCRLSPRLTRTIVGIREAEAWLDKLAPAPADPKAAPPVGHTAYSWSDPALSGAIPVGHTAFSWGSTPADAAGE